MEKIQLSELYYIKDGKKINNMLKHQWDFDPVTNEVIFFYEDGTSSKFNIFELQSFYKGRNTLSSLNSSYRTDYYWKNPAISWKNNDLAELIRDIVRIIINYSINIIYTNKKLRFEKTFSIKN